MSWSSFDEVLRTRAATQPDDKLFSMWDPRVPERWLTYGELDRSARAIAAELRRSVAPGGRVLLLYPSGFDYVAAFFGCLYAGVIAVPAYPPDPGRLDRTLPRLQAIIDDAQAATVLTTKAILSFVDPILAFAPELSHLRWIGSDTLTDTSDFRPATLDERSVAFLQYTSGSTGSPKGVRVTHGNLLHNAEVIRLAAGYDHSTRMVTWLPPYHDLGLIGSLLQPVYTGFTCVMMSPVAFMLRPLRWLQAISETRGTTSGAPNFAFDLCVRKINAEQRRSLDLSSWNLAYCAGEPVRPETLSRFAQVFAECGFDKRAFMPCYGLAEATLMVSSVPAYRGPSTVYTSEVPAATVSMGPSVTGGDLLVVDVETGTPCDDGTVGEIWTQSGSVADGYWNRPKESEEIFGAHLADGSGPFLRTGDLGYLRDGELYVTGRVKELIIVRGRKHFPSDLEATVERTHWDASQLRAGGSAAFSVFVEGEEHLYLVIELERRLRERRASAVNADERRRGSDRRSRPFDYKPAPGPAPLTPAEFIRSIRQVIAAEHGVEPHGVALLRPGSIPKTSSGKKQRIACRKLFLSGGEKRGDVLWEWRSSGTPQSESSRRIRVA